MTLALTPNVKRICSQLALARRLQGQSQAVAADVAGLSIKGLNSLYAGRGSPQLATLNALAHMHGLGPITTVVTPERLDIHQVEGIFSVMPLINVLNAQQALQGRMRQRTLRSESRFMFARLNMGHRILNDRDVHDASQSASVSAVAMDIKALVLNQGGLRLRTSLLKYDGGTLDLDAAVALPVYTKPDAATESIHQGRGQTNDMTDVVPDGDDDNADPAEEALWDALLPTTNQGA